MIKLNIYRNIKRGLTLVEVSAVIGIILIIAGIATGVYFAIVESSKDSILRNESKQVLNEISIVSKNNPDLVSFSENGLYVASINDLEVQVNKTRTSDNYLKFVKEVPESISTYTVVLNQYDEADETYFSFIYISINVYDRWIVTAFNTGDTTIEPSLY